MASAGRILIMPKGAYNSNTTYEMLDLVNHNGISWLAKKTVVGIEPSDANAEYWQNMFALNIVNNLDATEEGGVLDSRMGKHLADLIATRHKTATATETLKFENGVAEFTTDLSAFGGCFNVLVTGLGVSHAFSYIIADLNSDAFRIQVFDITEPTSTREVVFRITYFFGS